MSTSSLSLSLINGESYFSGYAPFLNPLKTGKSRQLQLVPHVFSSIVHSLLHLVFMCHITDDKVFYPYYLAMAMALSLSISIGLWSHKALQSPHDQSPMSMKREP